MKTAQDVFLLFLTSAKQLTLKLSEISFNASVGNGIILFCITEKCKKLYQFQYFIEIIILSNNNHIGCNTFYYNLIN